MLFGPSLLGKLGISEPAILTNLREQKMLIIGVHFMLNMISSKLSSSGAFEIVYDNYLLHSKLETNTVPTSQDIISKLIKLGLTPIKIPHNHHHEPSIIKSAESLPGSEEFIFDNTI